jgi:hypothetical protein
MSSSFSSPLGPVEEAKIPEVSINLVVDPKFIPGTIYAIDWDRFPTVEEQIEKKFFPLLAFASKPSFATRFARPFLRLKYVTTITVNGKEPTELGDKELIRSMGLVRVAFDIIKKTDDEKSIIHIGPALVEQLIADSTMKIPDPNERTKILLKLGA